MIKTVLITGAAGRIGSALVKHLTNINDKQYKLVPADLNQTDDRGINFDITDFDACQKACESVDTVIHLAGIAHPDSPFDALLPVNIVGTYNIFQASCNAGVRRVIFASSVHAIEGYAPDVQVHPEMPVRPKNFYGVSKVFGEALASYFAYEKKMETIAIRIGAFEYSDHWTKLSSDYLSTWIDPDDLCALFAQCLEVELGQDPFLIAHGISNNRFKRLDITNTQKILKYNPKSDAFSTWNIELGDSNERKKE